MKNRKIVFTFLLAVVFMSFISPEYFQKPDLNFGTFSTCGCDNPNEKLQNFGLTLNQDYTFHFFDNSNPDNKMQVFGTWSLQKNTIELGNYTSNIDLDNKWTIDNSGKCIKSVKGITFTRLCNIEACN